MAQLTSHLYLDDAPFFAARQISGCFTAAQVRNSLGQHVARLPQTKVKQANGLHCNHFLPHCICSPLHVNCGDYSPQESGWATIKITLEQIRAASEAGCPFCRTLYGGCIAAPPWDPSRAVKTPRREPFELSTRPESLDFGVALHKLQDPPLMFYINEEEGS